MSGAQIEIQLIAIVVAVSCSLVGTFLTLKKMSMMADAIGHSVLLGIALAFFATKSLTSPFLILAAALTGLLAVALVESLNRTKLLNEDAATGAVFPLLFSLGVILISRYAGNIHLDIDSVLMGELAFAPFDRLVVFGTDIGARALYVSGAILLLIILFIALFYKELALSIFDPLFARAAGVAAGVFHYALMTLVSITAVGAFDAVGAILVIALMVTVPSAAYLLVERLSSMLIVSAIIAVGSAVGGYWLAHALDVSIAGSIAVTTGCAFVLAFVVSPERGLVAAIRRRRKQNLFFTLKVLLAHIAHHEERQEAETENRFDTLSEHLIWNKRRLERAAQYALREGYVVIDGEIVKTTEEGRALAERAIIGSGRR